MFCDKDYSCSLFRKTKMLYIKRILEVLTSNVGKW